MSRTIRDISYYELRLKELLDNSFPELSDNTAFIKQRSELAATTYEQAFKSGNQLDQCGEIAEIVLFEDLHFSKFDTVFQVVCQEFDTIMADEELRPFALKMFPVCLPLFEQYELTDNFAYTTHYDLLYTEITGTIQIWIEEHGLW